MSKFNINQLSNGDLPNKWEKIIGFSSNQSYSIDEMYYKDEVTRFLYGA